MVPLLVFPLFEVASSRVQISISSLSVVPPCSLAAFCVEWISCFWGAVLVVLRFWAL